MFFRVAFRLPQAQPGDVFFDGDERLLDRPLSTDIDADSDAAAAAIFYDRYPDAICVRPKCMKGLCGPT